MSAYCISRFRFKGREKFYGLFTAGILIPLNALMVPYFVIINKLGLYDTYGGMILLYTAIGIPMSTFLIRGLMDSIPMELEEAAYIDGANDYTVLFSIYIRMVLPQAVVLFVLSFMGAWNDYNTYLIWLPSTPNISYGMYLFYQRANAYRVSLPELMAGFTVVMLPTVILYCGTQKIITGKVVVGGLKG